jgi:hypothetical protein
MMDFHIAKMQIEREMQRQFEVEQSAGPAPETATPRTGIVTTMRLRLSADLRALAAAIEPRQALASHTGTSHR